MLGKCAQELLPGSSISITTAEQPLATDLLGPLTSHNLTHCKSAWQGFGHAGSRACSEDPSERAPMCFGASSVFLWGDLFTGSNADKQNDFGWSIGTATQAPRIPVVDMRLKALGSISWSLTPMAISSDFLSAVYVSCSQL